MSLVEFEVDGRGVAFITLNRPERLNAVNLEMRDLLWEYLGACRDMPEVQVMVFRGNGRCFSAGADISEFGTAPSIIEARRARHERDVWDALLHHRCTTIAAMHGFCFGAGLELPLYCDIRVASEGATFALPEVSLGYIPSAGATQTLPRVIPPGVAVGMILAGEPIDAAAALRWGLVDDVVAGVDLVSATERRIERALAEPDALQARRATMRSSESAAAAAWIR